MGQNLGEVWGCPARTASEPPQALEFEGKMPESLMGQQLQWETLNPCTATVILGTCGTLRLAAPRKKSEGKRGLPQPVLLRCPRSSRTSSGEARRDAQGAAEQGEPPRDKGSFHAEVLGAPPTPTPGTSQRPRLPSSSAGRRGKTRLCRPLGSLIKPNLLFGQI